jgi:hypothetical protein
LLAEPAAGRLQQRQNDEQNEYDDVLDRHGLICRCGWGRPVRRWTCACRCRPARSACGTSP